MQAVDGQDVQEAAERQRLVLVVHIPQQQTHHDDNIVAHHIDQPIVVPLLTARLIPDNQDDAQYGHRYEPIHMQMYLAHIEAHHHNNGLEYGLEFDQVRPKLIKDIGDSNRHEHSPQDLLARLEDKYGGVEIHLTVYLLEHAIVAEAHPHHQNGLALHDILEHEFFGDAVDDVVNGETVGGHHDSAEAAGLEPAEGVGARHYQGHDEHLEEVADGGQQERREQ